MTIAPPPTVAPQAMVPFIQTEQSGDPTPSGAAYTTGRLTTVAVQFLTQLFNQFVSTNRIIPCNCTNTSNLYTLTMLASQPVYTGYATFDTFAFVASATSTGLVTANIVPSSGTLATIKVFKQNGAAQATTSDITTNLQYFLTFVDTLDGGNGGFVLR